MEGIEIHSLSYCIDIWCDCGEKFTAIGDEDTDSKCPYCGAMYSVLPVRLDDP